MIKTVVAILAVLGISATGLSSSPAHAGGNMTVERSVESFNGNYTGCTYRALTGMEKSAAALGDPYTPEQYGSIMNRTRFAALLDDEADGFAPLTAGPYAESDFIALDNPMTCAKGGCHE